MCLFFSLQPDDIAHVDSPSLNLLWCLLAPAETLREINQPTKFMSGKDDKQSVRPNVLVTKNQSIFLILD